MADALIIDFEPIGRRVVVSAGTTLLDAARQAGIDLTALCGGAGTCGTCLVRPVAGSVSPLTPDERVQLTAADHAAGLRLACQAVPWSDARIEIPPQSLTTPQRTQVEGRELSFDIDPCLVALDIDLPQPDVRDLRSDHDRLLAAAPGLDIPYPVLTGLSTILREQGWRARLVVDDTARPARVAAVLPPGAPLFGLAVDIGTTKLAAYLVDLISGVILARLGAMNPQIAYGEDVIARIAYCNQHADGRALLQSQLVTALNEMLVELCQAAGVWPGQVVAAAVVGNTAMSHLFAGLPVRQLGAAPYVPAVSQAMVIPAGALGLNLPPAAPVYLPPNIAGYVGGDHVAALLSSSIADTRRAVLLMDIGTNTEITLAVEGKMYACSCASGPAFEGAHIQAGMRAAPGAVERVQIRPEGVRLQTIAGQPPVGLCGSGILDAVAQMRAAGIIASNGALDRAHARVRPAARASEYVLLRAGEYGASRDLTVTRSDINQIQLAKAAIRAGVEVLLAEAGLSIDRLDEFIIAGAFGTYLDVDSAMRIGMFPALPLDRFRQVGNAAGAGARVLLLSRRARAQAAVLAARVTYLELTTTPGFTERYVEAMRFE